MVKLRLQRFGNHKHPKYRIVASDSRSPRDGKFLEIVGTYEPKENPAKVSINAERANYWLSVGAKPTMTVKNLFKHNKING